MKTFLDSRQTKANVMCRLRKLPQLPPGEPAGPPDGVPDRLGKLFKPGDGLKHGLHIKSQPSGRWRRS